MSFKKSAEAFVQSVPTLENRILHTPLATLCSQGRHSELPIGEPVGFWAHQAETGGSLTHVCSARWRHLIFSAGMLRRRLITATILTLFSVTATWHILTRSISFITNPRGRIFISASLLLWRITNNPVYVIPPCSIDSLVRARQ